MVASRALPGGDIADVSLLRLDNHTEVVAKRPRADQPDTTAVEAKMLVHLAKKSALPVPKVLLQAKGILVISYIPHRGMQDTDAASMDVAEHISALHRVRPKGSRPYYGHDIDTFIGPLPQINKPASNWCEFFAENRVMAMAQSCANTHKIDVSLMTRIETFSSKLPNYLPKLPKSSLLHGDLWNGNMLIDGDKAAAFIDPAISYGHAEMDLAFAEMMGGLSPNFLENYHDLSPIEPGYREERRAIYQLWPLLVHVRLFGGGYVSQVEAILARFGC
ncbi:MAG: fructosamine kinase family protein [Kordiimonadaceae bacterium]|nr:fructosamine kinase family protein [Kordiimonadaceae bacterium]